MTLRDDVVAEYRRRFGKEPRYLVRAPGRVNLIGEHTDYNDGFVLPMAIDRAVWIALHPTGQRQVRLYSLDYKDRIEFDLDHLAKIDTSWVEYVKGVAWALMDKGLALEGWEGVMAGDVPIGAGLSSSAALELAIARVFAAISDIDWDPAAMAMIGKIAENQWVGVNCGIMDQMISAAGQDGHALLIDCRTLEARPAPMPSGCVAVVLDTNTRRGLVGSAYNERRAQCQAAARFMGAASLRDVTAAQFTAAEPGLDAVTARRARHVVTENARTLAAVDAMLAGDAAELGRLMYASHVSLRDDFEVSNDALNTVVECARRHAACFGVRMTGAGFGGCAVALVQADQSPLFCEHVAAGYRRESGYDASIYVCRATAGAAVIPLP